MQYTPEQRRVGHHTTVVDTLEWHSASSQTRFHCEYKGVVFIYYLSEGQIVFRPPVGQYNRDKEVMRPCQGFPKRDFLDQILMELAL